MDRESKLLLLAMMLIGTAIAARNYPEPTFEVLWAFLAGAALGWAARKRA